MCPSNGFQATILIMREGLRDEGEEEGGGGEGEEWEEGEEEGEAISLNT